jgi:hypothetical protein
MMMSPDFKHGISFLLSGLHHVTLISQVTDEENDLEGWDATKKVELCMMSERAKRNGKIIAFYTQDSKFVGILLKKGFYRLFRTSDGSFACEMHNSYFEPALSEGVGGSAVILGIIDTCSRKYLPWSIEGLIHVS